MIPFIQYLNEKVNQTQINDLEKFADRILKKFKIDIEFTKHFVDRVNDSRNDPEITIIELQKLFKKIKNQHGENLIKAKNTEVVLKDLQSDLNLPVVVKFKKGEFEVTHKTIMRKKNFKTKDKVIKYK